MVQNTTPKQNVVMVNNATYYDPQKCGISLNANKSYQLKIMGGRDVETGEHPWTVAIYYKGHYCCVGTLISTKHAITAAHCFLKNVNQSLGQCRPEHGITEEETLQQVKVMYGSKCLVPNRVRSCAKAPPMKRMAIVRAQYGRFFRQNCFGADIALLEMEHEIDEKDANYICLASRILLSKNARFYTIQAVGWGNNPIVRKELMDNLQKLEFHRFLDQERCRQMNDNLVPDDILCTEEAYNQNVCLGDSGGGLMAQLHNGRWLLLAVTSYGRSCEKLLKKRIQPLAQVYTDIRMYSGEIDKFTGYLLPWEEI
uniref:Peptidase S1 domain-containing protein n=1 Tax=Onchocerca volvulus TaxID=6282 RepID=A0A8R1Y588_ONCVO